MPHLQASGPSLPAPICGNEPDTWAHDTIVRRLPEIARRVLVENSVSPRAETAIYTLIADIPDSRIRPLADGDAPDAADWTRYITPHRKHNWLDVPWYFAEAYFYRRILEATGYFGPGNGQQVDPFALQKRRGLETTRSAIHALSAALARWLKPDFPAQEALVRLLTIALWGNRADLSLWPAGESAARAPALPEHDPADHAHMLINHAPVVAEYLLNLEASSPRVHFLVDNAGFELVCDLALVDFLLSRHLVTTVTLNLKVHPTFVSDAMIGDVQQTITVLAGADNAETRALGLRLQHHLNEGALRLRHHFFWTAPLGFREMPSVVFQSLSNANLVISKGDANYRRLLGDRHWPYHTPFADIVNYFPAPLVALRTFKSELAAGLPKVQVAALSRKDPHWLTNGKRGIIQLYVPSIFYKFLRPIIIHLSHFAHI